jgi:hypothetical protein
MEALELLALSGIAAPLMLSNVSYRTRDALLLYNNLRLMLHFASLRRVPTGAAKTLFELVLSWGIDGKLLHDIEATPLRLSEINGQWALAARGGLVTVAALVSSRSELDQSTLLILRLAALLGQTDLVSSSLGVTAALWRAKRHEAFAWSDAVNEVVRIERPDGATAKLLQHARAEAAARAEREPTYEELRLALSLRARLFCVALLAAVPLANFDASGHAAAAVALLASPAFRTADDLLVTGLVLRVLYSLGLDGALAEEMVRLTERADGEGGPTFRSEYLALHAAVHERLARSEDTELALVDLRRYGHKTPGVLADRAVTAQSPLVRLETTLEALAQTFPRSEQTMPKGRDARASRAVAHDSVFAPLPEHYAAAVAGQPPAALSAALAGAGSLRLLTQGHSPTAAPREG